VLGLAGHDTPWHCLLDCLGGSQLKQTDHEHSGRTDADEGREQMNVEDNVVGVQRVFSLG
jgi:hypothetical protein